MEQQVSLWKRIMAYGIDLYLGALCGTLPISIITYTILGEMTQNIFLLEKWLGIVALLFSLSALFIYYILIPLKVFKGQTLGKKMMHIEIQYQHYHSLILRQFLMMIFFTSLTKVITQLMILISGIALFEIMNDITMFISIVSIMMLLFSKQHLTLHDRIAKTNLQKI